jgi:hypothetical protein
MTGLSVSGFLETLQSLENGWLSKKFAKLCV